MALLIDQNKVKHQPTLLSIAAFAPPLPIDTFKCWLLAYLLRSKKHHGNADVDFNSDPLYVVFDVAHADLLLGKTTGADHIGFFFGNDKQGGNKHQNMTCFMSLTKEIDPNRFDIITGVGQEVYEGDATGSSPKPNFLTKINNYRSPTGRIKNLRKPGNPHRAEFNENERNGVHYPLADFQTFIHYIKGLTSGTNDKFKSFFVKRTDTQTTTLVHSPFDFVVESVLNSTRSAGGDQVYDQGTGCCPI